MLRGDGTHSDATGLMTGRGANSCVDRQNRNRANNGSGNGGAGRGRCGWFKTSELAGHSARENESRLLREKANALKDQLDEVNRRLNEL